MAAAMWRAFWSLDGIQFPQGLAALIADNSNDGIRVCAAILAAAAVLTGPLFQNRPGRCAASSLGREASAAFIFFD